MRLRERLAQKSQKLVPCLKGCSAQCDFTHWALPMARDAVTGGSSSNYWAVSSGLASSVDFSQMGTRLATFSFSWALVVTILPVGVVV